MTRFFASLFFLATALAVAVSSAQCQSERPLGDLAREQRSERNQQNPGPSRVFTNLNVVSVADESSVPVIDDQRDKSTVSSSEESDHPVQTRSSVFDQQRTSSQREEKSRIVPGRSSVFDRDPDPANDEVIVPAGTQIRVNMLDRLVSAPVRVGFATPIPAWSKASVRFATENFFDGLESWSETVTYLTGLMVNGTNNEIAIDSQPACSEQTGGFRLLKPLILHR